MVVPNGWEEKKLGDIAIRVSSGITKVRKDNGKYPLYGSTGLIGYTDIPDYSGKKILIARVGANAGIINIVDGIYGVSDNTLIVEINDNVDLIFLYSQLYNKKLNHLIFGSGQPLITGAQLKGLDILLPQTKTEQGAIAAALSETDSLIAAMEKLIAKKRAIKQGTMQELLTGKRRLPWFSGEWVEKELATLCEIFCDGDWIESKDQSNEGIRLIQTGNIGIGCFLNKSDKKRFISEQTFTDLNCTEIFPNDVLVSRLPDPAGRACLIPKGVGKAITAVDCTIIRLNNYNPVLFVMYTQTPLYQKQVDLLLAGSTRQRISRKELGMIKVPYFSSKEQTAIASILSDMDTDIEKLTAKLNKLRHIKQGMMSELLTGHIRLIEQEAIDAPLEKVVESTKQKPVVEKKQRSANVHFKRSVWAAEIADRLYGEPTFGHVKMEKMIFITENLCNVDIGSNYHRDAAGPYDNRAIRSIDTQLKKQEWFELVRGNKGYRYFPLSKRGGHKEYFNRYYSNALPIFDKIINLFRTWNTERCEIVATLYSAWKDMANSKQEYTDEDIIYEVLNNWNKSKKLIEKERWQKALNWMRENDLSPVKEERTTNAKY